MKPITIIGGGLAGLTAGIMLRRENVPVTIIEAGRYPRHRVCGEFISGQGVRILNELGLEPELFQQGAMTAANAAFFIPGEGPLQFELPAPALTLSRFSLDALLAREFKNRGGELREGERSPSDNAEGTVFANGRRRAESARSHLFGLKAHATAALSADLEMHFAPNRYVGLCRLGGGRVNVCGLFYSTKPAHDLHTRWHELLSHSIPALRNAIWREETFCAVAGLTLDPSPPSSRFSIGDAASMIPPITGNGMSMAFESAAMAAPLLRDYSLGKISWLDAMARHSSRWHSNFYSRLRWAGFSQRWVFSPIAQRRLFSASRIVPALPRLLFQKTR